MEKKKALLQLNNDSLDMGKVLFAGGFCASFLAMFGFSREAAAAFAYCVVVSLLCQIVKSVRKPFGYALGALQLIVCGVAAGSRAVSGFQAFANEISRAFGSAYGRIFPIYEDVSAKSPDKIAFALVLGAVCIVLSGLLVNLAGRGAAVFGMLVMLALISTAKADVNVWFIVMIADCGVLAGQKKGVLRTAVSAAVIFAIALVLSGSVQSAGLQQDGAKLQLTKSDQIALSVTMEKPQSMYLKGETFDVYEKGLWKDFSPEKKYESRELFYWLHEDGFYGQTQMAEAAVSFDEKLSEKQNTVTVEVKGADKNYRYVPYELFDRENANVDKNVIGDAEIASDGMLPLNFGSQKTYTFQTLPNQVKSYSRILAAIVTERTKAADGEKMGKAAEKYLDMEAYYNNYVYENYTEISDNQKALFEGILGKYNTDGKNHYDYLKAKEKVLEFFADNISYDEEADYSGDFLEQFLSVGCKGYSVHYAGAGVLMMRYYGIPARLASGYLITKDDAKLIESGNPFNVTEERRHFWIEYYQDGIGWVPFEVTTPYIGLMESENHLAAVSEKPKDEPEEKHEIKQDNYKKPDKKKDKEDKEPWLSGKAAVILAVICLLIVMATLAGLYFARKRKIMKVRKSMGWMSDDLSRRATGEYMLMLEICGKYGSQCQEPYEIYQKARYSEKGINEEEYGTFADMTGEKRKAVYEGCSRLQKVLWKYWYFY